MWRKCAIFVTAFMFIVLIVLTFHSMSTIQAGTKRVPAYSVINQRIFYKLNDEGNRMMPVIGEQAPLFGKTFSEDEAEQLVTLGKLTIQGKNYNPGKKLY